MMGWICSCWYMVIDAIRNEQPILVTAEGIVLRVDGEIYSGTEVAWYRGDQDRYSSNVQCQQ